jgi:hypothetical protein
VAGTNDEGKKEIETGEEKKEGKKRNKLCLDLICALRFVFVALLCCGALVFD